MAHFKINGKNKLQNALRKEELKKIREAKKAEKKEVRE